jgi:RecA/RadA recombinase
MAKSKLLSSDLDIENTILKDFGNVFMPATKLKEDPPLVIPTTPCMDLMLGGGVPEGSFVVISGPPGLGKSALSLHLAGNAQKIDSPFGPRKVFYFDIEGRIKERDLFTNHNLDTSEDKFQLIKSNLEKIIVGEEFLDIGERLIRHKPGCVFIFDSFSAICTSARHENSFGDRFRDDSSLLLSDFCKRIAQIIPVNKSIVIGITHRIANQGPGISKWTEASGQKIQYQADVKIKGAYASDWKIGETQVGQDVHWECEKAALRGPGATATCKLRYKHGFDIDAELAAQAIELGFVRQKGAWITIQEEGKEPQKINGSEKFNTFLQENPEFKEHLKKQIRELYS